MNKALIASAYILHATVAAGQEAASVSVLDPPRERTFELTYVSELDVPAEAKRVNVWIPYPPRSDHQDVRLLSIDAPVPTKVYQEYTYRNSMLFLSAVPSPEMRSLRVEMKFRVTRREYERRDFWGREDPEGYLGSEARQWLRPNRLVPLDAYVRQLAEEVTEGETSVIEKARAIYDYTVDTLEYDKSGTGWGRGDIYYACDTKRGNCTDFHAVFTGFARAVGIPAKFAIGLPLPPERGEGEIAGYHCWAEFYVPGYGWVPVDTSEANKNPELRDYFFGAHDENRVEFTVGRDIELNPQPAGEEPLNYFIYPYAEADGKPLDGIRKQFFFKDLPTPSADE